MSRIAFFLMVAVGLAASDDVLQFRREREAELKADDGWLTVSGLFWLKEGPNRFGSAPSNDIVLPPGAPSGVLEFHSGKTAYQGRELRADKPGPPDRITLGDLTLYVIERSGRYAIRLKDKNSKFRREFTGLRWFPPKGAYRVTARFVPYSPPKTLSIPTILGDVEKLPSPGYAVFTLHGHELRLDPVPGDNGGLFFIFRDLTTGKETYPAGRFLDTDPPRDGKLVLDFNKAYNPPCAFTPYATCPLPPKQNHLPVRIEAGELNYHYK
ncbi:MAG: DUF1684 domain-containing protein [Acidobacteria bacterium]|nr:DUF1684 domain-containing protein [Acidobacteriota bacterium]